MWRLFDVELLVDRLTAGIPANPELLRAWLAASSAPTPAVEEQTAMLQRVDPEAAHAVVFYRDVTGRPCYESRGFKAALKEGANVLKDVLRVRNLRALLAQRVFVSPKLVPIRAEVHVAERPIRVMTRQGPRTSLKRYEFADGVRLRFRLKLLDDGVVEERHLRRILDYLQESGLGADRSQGSGTFRLVFFAAAQQRG